MKKIDDLLAKLLPQLIHELSLMPSAKRQELIGTIVTTLSFPATDLREAIQVLLKASITMYLMTEDENSEQRFVGLVRKGFEAAKLGGHAN